MASPAAAQSAPADISIPAEQSYTAPDRPSTSADDDGTARRPRDARLIHLVLSSLGIHSYQERVPLQLLDFAYRYTSSVLSDSLRLSSEGYTSTSTATSNRRPAAIDSHAQSGDGSNISVTALRQAIASRHDYHFQARLPKEFLMEQASERNRIALPRIEKSWGVQLPPEQYCLTGTNWSIGEEWDSDDADDETTKNKAAQTRTSDEQKDTTMQEGDTDPDELEGGTFEDVFGQDGTADQDTSMQSQ